MINRLAELNRLLIAAATIASPGDLITQASVLRQCESIVIEGEIPDHNLTIKFAESIALVILKEERMTITNFGKEFLALNTKGAYELTDDQKRVLIRNHYLSGLYRSATVKIMKCFTRIYDAQTFRWSEVDSSPMTGDSMVIDHLIQLGLILSHPSVLEVDKEYVEAIVHLLAEEEGWTPDSLERHLAERKEIGEIAEELAFLYERERVEQMGAKVESLCISQISKLKPAAGYDLESFDGKSLGMVHDRFIEVKGAKSSKVRFYMSDNEIKVATKLKEKYWVYFVGGIDKKTKTTKNKPLLFQNPAETVLKNSKYKITSQGILIEEL